MSQINSCPDGFVCCGPISVELGGECFPRGGPCPVCTKLLGSCHITSGPSRKHCRIPI
ncbi:hypothetical protein BD779DRAFT_1163376 [Infundibulicybe gibba]|nr:hypothetical protein BD779DRAFT_1163376 [Infundibulicybe gibba]